MKRLLAALRGRAVGILRRARRWAPRVLVAVAGVGVVSIAVLYTLPLPERLGTRPSTFVTFADGTPAYVFLSPDDKYRMHVSPDEVDGDYLEALVRFEDKRFFHHPGVDPIAIVRSAWLNLRHGRVLTGASTLTMQLVRLLEPRPRTLGSKVVEAVRALQIELRLSKEEVLASYLAFLPFGGNLEGVEAASHAYFGHGADALSADEIAVLLAIPQRPVSREPNPANEERLRAARDEIANWLLSEGFDLGEGAPRGEVLARVQASAVPTTRLPMPREAPHLAFWARDQLPERDRIETTLDRSLQRLAQDSLAAEQRRFADLGIANGAMVVTDFRTGALVALVGGFDFWSPTAAAQIPAFDTPRSPGSALKPLIYALAIDGGLALPERMVADIPLDYGGYAPGNYDGRFAGLVSLESALSRSLNIPFVRLLSDVGVESFLATLRQTGFDHLDPTPGHYGLSAAIGAIDVTPIELAGLYSKLAGGGSSPPLHWRPPNADLGRLPAERILSPGSAFLTNRALNRRDRPDFPERRRYRGVSSRVHWKTGTSYGHRDAWAAGFADRYAAVVWLGNLDRTPSADLVGADAAGPLLFDLLESAEPARLPSSGRGTPSDLTWVDLCAESGYLPGDACPRRREALALRRSVPTDRCPFHRQFDVDLETGLALAPGCRQGRRWETRSFVVWPASLRRWLSERHRTLPVAPSLDPACRPTAHDEPPVILSPPAGQVLVLLPGLSPLNQEVPLQAEVNGPRQELAWFLDGTFLGRASSDESLWWTPEPGDHRIVVVDTAGRRSARRLEVRERL